jgi:outer membrane lipopolysaccharide assembly protein LptE/RlpB
MADDPKKIAEALERIKTLNEEVKRLGGEAFEDINAAVKSFGGGLKGAQKVIKELNFTIDDLRNSFDNVSTTLKNIVDDMGGMAKASRLINRGFDKLESSASKLSQHKNNEYILSAKQIKAEQAKQTLVVKDLEYQLTRLGTSEEDEKIKKELNAQLLKQEGIIDRLKTLTKETLEDEIKIQKTLGLTGQAFKGIAKTLQNIGVESESIEEINTSMRKAAEEGKTLKVVTEGLKGSFKAIKESLLTDPAVQLAFLTKTFQTLYNIGINFSKDTANLARELGISSKNAATLNREFYSLTLSSKNAFGNQQNFLKATLELNESLGTSAVFSEKVLSTQAQISKVTGLTAEESADIYKLSLLNGKTQEEIYDSVGAIRKGNLNNKKVLQEVLKTSGQLAAQYKNNPKELGKAVVQAQKLGLTLEQTKNISKNLLNFEDSISAELEAELLTGKNLNLERARYLALMGDSAGAAEELMENLGPNGLEKFQKMNVIQQESYARALGMSADELADSLVKQKQLEKLGVSERANLKKRTEELRKAGEYEKADQLEKLALKNKDVKLSEQQLDAQARIAQAADTFKSSIQAVIAGPLGYLADKVAKIMETISKSPFAKTVLGGIGSIAAVAAAASSVYLIGKTLVNSFKGRPSGRPGDPIFTTEEGTGGGTSGVDLDSLGKGAKPASIGKQIKTLIKNPKAYMRALKKAGKLSKFAKVGGGIASLLGGVALDYAEQKQFEKAQKLKEQGKLEEANQAKNLGKVASVGSSTLTGAGIGGSIGALFGGIGAVPGAVIGGTLGAGYGALQNYLSDDTEPPAEDFIMQGGKMTRFRKDDVVVGGTNLGGGDNTEVVALLKELIITVKSGGNVYLDGTKVGTAMAMSTYKS